MLRARTRDGERRLVDARVTRTARGRKSEKPATRGEFGRSVERAITGTRDARTDPFLRQTKGVRLHDG